MKQSYMVFGIIILLIVFYFVRAKLKNQSAQPDTDMSRPSDNHFPSNKIINDKLLIVEDINEEEIKRILQDFCNLYNKEKYQAIPRLTNLSNKRYAITFPYDIDFEILCYFINYLNYPMHFKRHFKTVGWTTTGPTDSWIMEQSANKKVMLFVSKFDTEYDNVFLTTSDNIGYKLGFSIGETKQLLDRPEESYVKQPLHINKIETKLYVDFK